MFLLILGNKTQICLRVWGLRVSTQKSRKKICCHIRKEFLGWQELATELEQENCIPISAVRRSIIMSDTKRRISRERESVLNVFLYLRKSLSITEACRARDLLLTEWEKKPPEVYRCHHELHIMFLGNTKIREQWVSTILWDREFKGIFREKYFSDLKFHLKRTQGELIDRIWNNDHCIYWRNQDD